MNTSASGIKSPDLIAHWPAPSHISALTTTRATGISLPPYAGNNLALHVGDQPADVQHNRETLITRLGLPNPPAWLEQTHSTHCVMIDESHARQGDAAITRNKSTPLAIMTADCLPIVLCDTAGTEIAAIHAGWRGLLNGIIDNTLLQMQSSREALLAWIGPAICVRCYETGLEVRDAFIDRYPYTQDAFYTNDSRLHANLPKLAEHILHAAGVSAVYQSHACTFERKKEFYSYRQEAQTGRMATLIWFNQG